MAMRAEDLTAFLSAPPVPAGTRRAAIYVRVSDPKQERDGTSLGTQEAAALLYAVERAYAVRDEHIYREVHTGVELWERKQLQKLREAIRRREVDVVVCYAIDRLARDPVHLGVLISEADHAGVDVEFITEPLDNSPEGQLIRFVRGYAAKVEHEKIRERTTRGIRARVEAGKPLAGRTPLYGYRWRDAEKSGLETNPTTAPTVRRLFDAAARGARLRALAASLTAEGIPTPQNGRTGDQAGRWQHSSVRCILTTPAYTGRAAAFRRRVVKGRTGGKSAVARPESEQVGLPEGTVPALVDEALFQAVQGRLSLNKATAARNNQRPEASLLRGGYARCGDCGGAMAVAFRRRDGTLHYRCGRAEKSTLDCIRRSIHVPKLDGAVWARVEALLTRPDVIAGELERLRRDDPTSDDLAAVDRRLEEIGRRQRNLLDQVAEFGGSVAALASEKLAELEQQRGRLEAERETVANRRAAWEGAQGRIDDLQAWCRTVGENLAELTYDRKRAILDALGVQVRVYRADHAPRWEIKAEIPLDCGQQRSWR